MASEQRLAGVFTPNIVPLDRDGGINEAELRRYVDWLIAKHTNPGPNEWASAAALNHRRVEAAPRQPTLDDLLPFVGGGIAIAGVAILASYLPGRRATEIDPAEALRID